MEAIVFLVIWIGGAALQTLYELKIKPLLDDLGNGGTDIPLR